MNSPLLSIIVPVYNEEENIVPFFKELLLQVPDDFELIWVDDGSTDRTLLNIMEQAANDTRIRALSFSRNFGHQPALLAGMQIARGELTLIMDGDLQHPPSLIPELLREFRKGYEMVSARRMPDKNVSFKSLTSHLYYRILNFLSDTKIETNEADFRLFSGKVREAILSFPERDIFLRGMFGWIGFKRSSIDYIAPKRKAGHSKYSTGRMFSLGLRGVVGFSFKPLRISLYTGLFISLFAFCFAIYALVMYLQQKTVPGWTSLIIAVMFLGGIQLIMIGLIGEYIASLFSESKKRPVFIIDRKINC